MFVRGCLPRARTGTRPFATSSFSTEGRRSAKGAMANPRDGNCASHCWAVAVWLFWNEPSARSEEQTSELQSLMRISYACFCLKQKQSQQISVTTIFGIKPIDNNS